MIYAENKNDLSEIMEALCQAGIPQRIIDIGTEFLESGDISLLKNISPQVISQPTIKGSTWDFERKFKNKVNPLKNPELFKRFVQFAYAVCGCGLWKIIDDICHTYSDYNKECRKICTDAVYTLTGISASALLVAMDLDRIFGNSWASTPRCYFYYADKSADVYLESAGLMKSNNRAKVLLCAMALNVSENYDDTAKKCVDIIMQDIAAAKNNYHPSDAVYKIAIAECAYFDEKAREMFKSTMKVQPELLIEFAINNNFNINRINKLIFNENIEITVNYVYSAIMTHSSGYKNPRLYAHLKNLALHCESKFISAVKQITDSVIAKKMLEILQEVKPEYAGDDLGLKEIAKERYINYIRSNSHTSDNYAYEYIMGRKSLDEAMTELQKGYSTYGTTGSHGDYIQAYGVDDDVIRRSIVFAFVGSDNRYVNPYSDIKNFTGFKSYDNDNGKIIAEILFSEKVPVEMILNKGVRAEYLVSYAEQIAEVSVSELTADGRERYVSVLSDAGTEKYKEKILAMTDDTSKAVKTTLVSVISKMRDWQADIIDMLNAKKAGKRELALDIIEKMQGIDWTDALKKALEKEKSEKLKVKTASLLGIEHEQKQETKSVTDNELVDKLTKGSKSKKVDWLYKSAYNAVHFADGSEVDEKYMRAILLCYANNDYNTGKNLAEKLNTDELAKFTAEVFGRWIDDGAVAKNKWVLILYAIHGDNSMISTLVSYIKTWSENMRGAMAVSAVKALAMNGSQQALLQVDNMARKFKSNQVKNASREALYEAAEFLGITQEELADRIVPDFNFDEKMCRVFDYGTRKFSVYLTPALEIEIYNGDKKVKNLPKPCASDTAEIAEKSYAEFKEMKKQLKTAVTLQKTRLEYTLMCERKWTAENWKKLFVKNPLMHCFAVGLIWGIYDDGKLVSSFRYLDDGSFTTSDEDEFEIPENAQISLVHPVELSEEELSAWSEQLVDYEIVQPFAQLTRTVYRPTVDEIGKTEIMRFHGKEVVNQVLTSRMEKNGWERGEAMDGGCFCEFYHYDINKRVKTADNKSVFEGYMAELTFSGTYIGVYQIDAEDVDVEEVRFYRYGDYKNKLKADEVSPRYFSEIIMQLTAMF